MESIDHRELVNETNTKEESTSKSRRILVNTNLSVSNSVVDYGGSNTWTAFQARTITLQAKTASNTVITTGGDVVQINLLNK